MGLADQPELARAREILVGPHLREHERRLSALERSADTTDEPPEWRSEFHAAILRERRDREEQAGAASAGNGAPGDVARTRAGRARRS